MLISGINAFCQAPPKEFFDGLDNLNTNQAEAKKDFFDSCDKSTAISRFLSFSWGDLPECEKARLGNMVFY